MVIVFQYGSNCKESEMNSSKRLKGDAKFLGVSETVENYKLAFDVYSKKRGCIAVADIVKSGTKSVWGILYDVPDKLMCRETKPQGRKSFDEIEGESINYQRHWLPVSRPDGEQLIALTYVARCPSQRCIGTDREYAQLIINGLREHIKDGIPSEYIDEVKQIIKKNNPKIDVTKL